MEVKAKVKCSVCHSCFGTVYNLRKHVKKYHADKANILAPPKSFNYHCPDCKRNFTHLRHLKYHQRRKHDEAPIAPVPKSRKCPLCDYSSHQTPELLKHFTQQHNIEMRPSTHSFTSLEEFNSWKNKTEVDTRAHFVKLRGAVSINTRQMINYICHRSGSFNSRSKGLRKLKNQGSNKIDGFCPAYIKVTVREDGACEVKFLATHVGHENDLGHLTLSNSERELIASKIAQKVPFTQILSEVRDSFQNSESKRIHLLTRKDLHNIKRSFNIQSGSYESETEAYLEQKGTDAEQFQSDDEEELIITTDCEEAGNSADDLKDGSVVEEIYIYHPPTLEDEKEKLKNYVLKLFDRITTVEQLEIMEQAISQMSSALNQHCKKEREN